LNLDPKHCSFFIAPPTSYLDEEDDGELRPVRKAPAIIKPPPNNTRLPANMENPRPNNNRPRIGGAPLWSAMAPPSTPNSHKVQGRVGENPGFFKQTKKQPSGFFEFLSFFGFFVFFIYAQKREFLGFF
jgi:hypothetical protein